jgi:hypothetical protein
VTLSNTTANTTMSLLITDNTNAVMNQANLFISTGGAVSYLENEFMGGGYTAQPYTYKLRVSVGAGTINVVAFQFYIQDLGPQ